MLKGIAPVTYRSGKLNPLLASIRQIQRIDFGDCLASDLWWLHVPEGAALTKSRSSPLFLLHDALTPTGVPRS
jgi:hypothetical protein